MGCAYKLHTALPCQHNFDICSNQFGHFLWVEKKEPTTYFRTGMDESLCKEGGGALQHSHADVATQKAAQQHLIKTQLVLVSLKPSFLCRNHHHQHHRAASVNLTS